MIRADHPYIMKWKDKMIQSRVLSDYLKRELKLLFSKLILKMKMVYIALKRVDYVVVELKAREP